jgi:hypothetical protein
MRPQTVAKLLLLVLMGWGLSAVAQQPPDDNSAVPPAHVVVDAGTPAAGQVDAGVTLEALSEDAELVIEKTAALVAKLKDDAASETKLSMLIAGLVLAALKLLLDLGRKFGPMLFQKKSVVRLVCLAFGVGIYFCDAYLLGHSWFNALIAAFGGPGAILLTEVLKLAGLRATSPALE